MAAPTDEREFLKRAEPFRRELKAHCYRMVGSVHDAEDLAQESLVRAWQRRETFEGRSSLRTWLYKIATHACLDALEKRPRRGLPAQELPASSPDVPPGPPNLDPVWLTPAPDELLLGTSLGPEARFTAKEGVALAFLAALQHLPPKQRAVLVLRDVLGWPAAEVADLLDLSTAAVNSALQRARETLATRQAEGWEDPVDEDVDAPTRALLGRYVRAWEAADLSGLVALLREDATMAMPPLPAWYQGREAVRRFIQGALLQGDARGRFRMLPISANGQPALAVYQRDDVTGAFLPLAIQVLELEGGLIASMTTFLDAKLFGHFELPPRL